MSGKYLLDTNAVIALFASDPNIIDRIRAAEEVFVPSIVAGELYYGARRSGRMKENLTRIDEFIASNVILNCDINTARWYGEIKDRLRQKGRPIPENDIWIAALAFQYNLVLISQDVHFEELENLQKETW